MERLMIQLFRFGSFYLLVRGLDQESFGIWTLFLIICAIFEMGRVGMVQNALIKFLAGTEERKIKARINTASLTIHVSLTIILVLLIAVVGRISVLVFAQRTLEDLLKWYIFTSFALIPFYQFNFIQQAHFDFRGVFFSNLVRHGLFFFYVLGGYLGDWWTINLIQLAKMQILVALAGSLVAYLLSRKNLFFSRRLDRWWLRWLFNYGKYVVGTNIASMFIKSIDQFMLGILISPIAVAIYGTAIKISNLVEVPTQSLAAIVYPKSARRIETQGKESLKHLYEKSVGVLLAIIVPTVILVLLFPAQIIQIVAGEQYLEAAPILRITMLFGLFVPFSRQFGTMMDAMGNPRLNFALVMLSAVLNLTFNYFFIQLWGIHGAAYATLLTFGILFVTNQVILYRKLNVQPFRVFFYALKTYVKGLVLIRQRLVKS